MAATGIHRNVSHAAGLVDIHLAVLLFGLAGLFGKFLILPAWMIVLGRTGFATIALGAILLFSHHRQRYPRDIGTMVRFGLLGLVLAVHWITFFHAIQVSSVAIGLLAFSTFPIFITGLEPWWFDERRRFIDLVTASMVVVGLVVMVFPAPFGGQIFSGMLWGTVSGFTFAILSLLNRKWVRDYPPVIIAFFQNGTATLLLIPMGLSIDRAPNPCQVGLLIVLGVVCTALSHTLFIRGLRVVRAQLAALIACLEPVYGILLAGLLLGEIPSVHTFAGGVVILAATVVGMLRRGSV